MQFTLNYGHDSDDRETDLTKLKEQYFEFSLCQGVVVRAHSDCLHSPLLLILAYPICVNIKRRCIGKREIKTPVVQLRV